MPWCLSSKESTSAQETQETQETQVQSLGHEDPLEKEMVTSSSILAQRIPWTEDTTNRVAKSQTGLK